MKAIQTENDELRAKLETIATQLNSTEKKFKTTTDAYDELKQTLEDEIAVKERAIKARKELEEQIDELKEQVEDAEQKLNDMEDLKHKKEIEAEDLRKKLEGEGANKDKFDETKKVRKF